MRSRLLLVLALVAACHADRITTQDPVVSFDAHVWAGGTLHLASSAFLSPSLPRVMLGNDTLPVQRLDSITLEVRVPDTVGTLELSIDVLERRLSLGSVVIHGFTGSQSVGQLDALYGSGPLQWPRSSLTFIVRVNGIGGQYKLLDSRTGSLTAFFPGSPFTTDCQPDGPSSAGGDWLVMTAGTTFGGPTPCKVFVVQPAGGALVPIDSSPITSLRNGRLSDGTWAWIGQWDISYRHPGGSFVDIAFGEGAALTVSPSGALAVPVGGRAFPGDILPVIRSGASPDTLHVPATWGSLAAAFSETEDTVYLLGEPWSIGRPSLLTADVPSAKIISSITDSLPDRIHPFPSMAVATDSGRPWLYVAFVDSTRFTLVVYDRRSMGVVAAMHGRPGSSDTYSVVRLAVDPIRRRLGAVVIPETASSFVLSLDLLP